MSTPGGPYWQQPSPGYPGGEAAAAPKDRTPLIVTLVALVVVAAAVTTTLLLAGTSNGTTPIAGPPSSVPDMPVPTTGATKPVPPSRSKPTTKPSTSSTPTSVEEILVEPMIPGWQGVLSYKENVAYDVPKDWKVESPGMLTGFEDNTGKPIAIMHGVTTYKPDACPAAKGSYRGKTGMVTAGKIDVAQAARGGVKLFADAAALNEDGTKAPVVYTEPVPVKVNGGKLDAMTATATVTPPQTGGCPAPTILFTSVAFANGENTALFMMYQDQGTPDQASTEAVQGVIHSLRPYTG